MRPSSPGDVEEMAEEVFGMLLDGAPFSRRCGAADEMSLRTANALVGNDADAAALECLGGLRLRSRETRAVSVAGADCQATIVRAAGGSVSLKINEAVVLRAGDELRLGIPRDGARAYVGVEGGIEAPLVLGSRSSDVRAGLGMAPLAAGDVVACLNEGGRAAPRRAKHDHMIRMKGRRTWTLRVLPGPGDPASDDGSTKTDADASLKALLAAGPFAASPRSPSMVTRRSRWSRCSSVAATQRSRTSCQRRAATGQSWKVCSSVSHVLLPAQHQRPQHAPRFGPCFQLRTLFPAGKLEVTSR